MKKFLITMAFCVASLSMTIPALARVHKDKGNFYDNTYEGSKLIAGDDIPTGYFCLFNSLDYKRGNFSIKSGTDTLISDSFAYNEIIYLEDDDVLHLNNCYAVPLNDTRIIAAGTDCMVEVGKQIPSGKYSINFLRDPSGTATCIVYKTLDFHEYVKDKDANESDVKESYSISNGSKANVELHEGEYIKLDGCYLGNKTDEVDNDEDKDVKQKDDDDDKEKKDYDITNVSWDYATDGDTVKIKWECKNKETRFTLELYRNDSKIEKKNTEKTEYDLTSLIKKYGEGTYKVSITPDKGGKSYIKTSETKKFTKGNIVDLD